MEHALSKPPAVHTQARASDRPTCSWEGCFLIPLKCIQQMNECLLCARPSTRLKRRVATVETVKGVVTVQRVRCGRAGRPRGGPPQCVCVWMRRCPWIQVWEGGAPRGLCRRAAAPGEAGLREAGAGLRGRAAPGPAAAGLSGVPGVAASLHCASSPRTLHHLHGDPETGSHGAGPTLAKCHPKYRKRVSQNTLQHLVFKIPGGQGPTRGRQV